MGAPPELRENSLDRGRMAGGFLGDCFDKAR
jgi:hypothetical protein